MTTLRADLYLALAEALAEPPDWLALAGYEWPLFEIAIGLAPFSEAVRRAVEPLGTGRAESLTARRARYTALFCGTGCPRYWLYESAVLGGRVLGPETLAVERLYHAAGLETTSAELPDHASMELAFLAHLAAVGQGSILPNERQFIEQHAGRWLPQLGRALARSGDEVYAPIGQLLADWLEESVGWRVSGVVSHVTRHSPLATCHSSPLRHLPVIPQADSCTLCGFCAQVCPTRALAVHDTNFETTLLLFPAACVGCGKCERVCEPHALKMKWPSNGDRLPASRTVLRQSPRARCLACDQPTVSRAELDFVVTRIGHPMWLDYCSECRSLFEEQP